MMAASNKRIAYRNRHSDLTWSVPSAFCNDWIALKILGYAEDLEIEKPFEIAYGFPNCEWTGGRVSPLRYEDIKQIESYFQAYSKFNVRCFATFNRSTLSADQLESARMWKVLDVIQDYSGGIIVTDLNLARKIKDKYPSIPLVASVIHSINNLHESEASDCIRFYEDSLNLFEYFVPMPEHFDDPNIRDFLDGVSDRVIVLANQTCVRNCSLAMKHYEQIERLIDTAEVSQPVVARPCDALNLDISKLVDTDLSFPVPTIESMSTKGYRCFKLQGRDHSRSLLFENIANYIFEPTGIVRQIKKALFSEESYSGIRHSIP